MAHELIDPPLDPARYPFAHPIRVRFAETDAMGVVHHASYIPWLEETRVALLAHGGHDYAEVHSGGLDLAVVDVAARY
ncbi:MAG: acyl-CoA thioesterase, partial [Gaiellales bacterium]